MAFVQFHNTVDGRLRIVVEGKVNDLNSNQSIVLSLATTDEQTTAVPLEWAEAGTWQAEFSLPDTVSEQDLFAEFRTLPGGSLVVVRLGEVPRLIEQIQAEITGAWWSKEREQATIAISIHNPGEGAVYLGSHFIQLTDSTEDPFEGGDAIERTQQVFPRLPGQVIPHLPFLINPGETVGITISFLPHFASVRLQIGADLWEIADMPLISTE